MGRKSTSKKGKGSKGFNKKNTDDFLQKNKKKTGVCETKSGLQYEIIDDIKGTSPAPDDSVEVEQRISLIDGTIIDDSYKRPDTVSFSLTEAITGYREGLKMMGKGSRYKLFIPPDLAWGARGAGSKIGPFATLIIDVRLINIFN
ncbi:MAG: FKBP-type peptidyl-prolyl cis-trans isomerase [Fibrobacteria bacterium]|nr:FKBP-type peptidyl-prolyl cis-trans isomerase [Fibrobacteria bacterium]